MRLPKKFPDKKILSIDIGGTLAKTAFYVPVSHQDRLECLGKLTTLTKDTIPSKLFTFNDRVGLVVELENGDKIFLKSFESNKLIEFINFVKDHDLVEDEDGVTIHATGGGAYKYQDLIDKEFSGKVKLNKYDEMQSLVDGMSFVLTCAKNSSYTYREGEGKKPAETNIASLDMSKNDKDSEYHEIFHICDS